MSKHDVLKKNRNFYIGVGSTFASYTKLIRQNSRMALITVLFFKPPTP
jgi:hypothetical protein